MVYQEIFNDKQLYLFGYNKLRHFLNQDTMKMSEKRKSINVKKIRSYDNKELY